MPPETTLHLTWAQTAWCLAFISAVVGGWFDLRINQRAIITRLDKLEKLAETGFYTRDAIDLMRRQAEDQHADFRRRMERVESVVFQGGKP